MPIDVNVEQLSDLQFLIILLGVIGCKILQVLVLKLPKYRAISDTE